MSDYDSIFSMRKWHHVAVCRSGSLMQAFVDGALIGEDTSASHSYAGGTLRVGADNGPSYYSPTCYFHGLRIIQGQALYTNSFTVPESLLPA